jgi:hypothetical protein
MEMLDGQTEVDDTFGSFLNYDGCSSGTSQPPSSYGYDEDKYISSPVAGPIHSLFGTPYMAHLSPEIMPRSTSPMDDLMDEDSEGSSSDQVLDSLIHNLYPRRNSQGEEIYHCKDAYAQGHSCDFEDKRKCNLRYLLLISLHHYMCETNRHPNRKHLEATLRTNICLVPECKNAAFSSKAVLTRHEKESHGMHQAEQFFCPVSTCERASRAFPREYNMCDHINRVHKEIDVSNFMKKTRKAKKPKSSSRSGSMATPVSVRVIAGTASKRSGSGRTKRDRLEKMERSYEKTLAMNDQLWAEISKGDRRDYQTKENIRKLRDNLMKLEDTLQALNNLEND